MVSKIDTKEWFTPNLTSELILNALIEKINYDCSILELGCGSGFIGIKLFNSKSLNLKMHASDISEASVEKAIKNYKNSRIPCQIKVSDGLSAWGNSKFDVIVSDVSAIDEDVANISNWYVDAPCKTGDGGDEIILRLISEVSSYLNKGGIFIFPLISLSNERQIKLHLLNHDFKFHEIFYKKWPLPEYFNDYIDELHKRKSMEHINFKEMFGKLICWTSVCIAHK